MPPQKNGGKLMDAVIADFEQWVKMGAPDPRDGKAAVVAPLKKWDAEAGKKWWAFQPCALPSVPAVPVPVAVKDAAWPRGDIDRFVLEGLEKRGSGPSVTRTN